MSTAEEDYFRTFDQRIEFLRLHEKLDAILEAFIHILAGIKETENADQRDD